MRALFSLFCFMVAALFAHERSVVKIHNNSIDYDYLHPWHPPGRGGSIGSGFVSENGMIITNAHVVENAVFLQVKLASDPRRFLARVVAIGHDCDLAVLKVDEPLFARLAKPLKWARQMPKVRDQVVAYGYPMGGEHLAITQGSVTRFEVSTYANQRQALMLCQLDISVSPGSSGGPVLDWESGEVVGVVHQITGHHQRITEMIPLNIVAHFLDGVAGGEHKGFFSPGFYWGPMEGAAMRRYFKMSPDETGVRVIQVIPGTPADGKLKKNDVIVGVDNRRIYNDGTYEYQKGQHLSVLHLFKSAKDKSSLKIDCIREGERITEHIEVDYSAKHEPLVPPMEYGKAPTYFIYAGLVFQPLTNNYIDAAIEKKFPFYCLNPLFDCLEWGEKKKPHHEAVLLSSVLPDECNVGYHWICPWVIESINGEEIFSMSDVVRVIGSATGEYLIIRNDRGNEMILDRHDCTKRNQAILKMNQIAHDRSADLRDTTS